MEKYNPDDYENPENYYRAYFLYKRMIDNGFPLEHISTTDSGEIVIPIRSGKFEEKFVPLPHTKPCIAKILRQGVPKGLRNDCTFILACFFRIHGFPIDIAARIIYEWNENNDPPLSIRELQNTILSAYSKSYGLSCHDPILRRFCNEDVCVKTTGCGRKPILKLLLAYILRSFGYI